MKLKALSFVVLSLFYCNTSASAVPVTNHLHSIFSDSTKNNDSLEVSLQYRTRNHLVIIPVKINDTLKVNLILDAQCKSVILFGKRYHKLLEATRQKSGLQENKLSDSKIEYISLNNKISVGGMLNENMPIVVMPNINALNFFTSVNGVIGYDFLSRFDVSIDRKTSTITFRPLPENSISDRAFYARHINY